MIILDIKETEKICPLCGKSNNCQHGKGGCWCDTVKVPKHVLDLVPDEKKVWRVYVSLA